MNDVESQADKVQWADDEVDLPSDCYSSSGDDSDAEVPDVTEPLASTSNGFQGTEDQSRALNLSSASGNNSVASTSRQSNKKESDLGQGWKPVIGGKLQGVEERASMQAASAGPPSLSPSSKQQTSSEKSAPLPSTSDKPKKDGNESDSDVRRVPEMSAKGAVSAAGSSHAHAHAHAHAHEKGATGPSSRKRGGASADKEHKRLKRLLRNRVSAQQARERKKAYLTELESRSKDLERRTAELEERVSTLQRENHMLRQIVKNTAIKKTVSGGTPGVGPQL